MVRRRGGSHRSPTPGAVVGGGGRTCAGKPVGGTPPGPVPPSARRTVLAIPPRPGRASAGRGARAAGAPPPPPAHPPQPPAGSIDSAWMGKKRVQVRQIRQMRQVRPRSLPVPASGDQRRQRERYVRSGGLLQGYAPEQVLRVGYATGAVALGCAIVLVVFLLLLPYGWPVRAVAAAVWLVPIAFGASFVLPGVRLALQDRKEEPKVVQGTLLGASEYSTQIGLGMLMVKTRGGVEQYLVPPDRLSKVPGNQVNVILTMTPRLRRVRDRLGPVLPLPAPPRERSPVPHPWRSPMRQPPEVPITAEGLEEVKRELDELVNVKRPHIVAKIKAAREHGDLSENFEYHAARNEQAFLETRIRELEAIVKNHVLIESNGPSDRVQLLSTVTFQEDGAPEETYRIVGPAEADPGQGRISFESELGKALLGRRVGEEVVVRTPAGGSYTVRVVRIE